jgi:hypothetical protein
MVPVVGTLLSIVLGLAKIATLIWVFYQTRRLAAIAYLTYLLIHQLFYTDLTQRAVNSIQSNGAMLWLGATSGERVSNFLFLERFISTGVETLLFIWLLLSLTRRTS